MFTLNHGQLPKLLIFLFGTTACILFQTSDFILFKILEEYKTLEGKR